MSMREEQMLFSPFPLREILGKVELITEPRCEYGEKAGEGREAVKAEETFRRKPFSATVAFSVPGNSFARVDVWEWGSVKISPLYCKAVPEKSGDVTPLFSPASHPSPSILFLQGGGGSLRHSFCVRSVHRCAQVKEGGRAFFFSPPEAVLHLDLRRR